MYLHNEHCSDRMLNPVKYYKFTTQIILFFKNLSVMRTRGLLDVHLDKRMIGFTPNFCCLRLEELQNILVTVGSSLLTLWTQFSETHCLKLLHWGVLFKACRSVKILVNTEYNRRLIFIYVSMQWTTSYIFIGVKIFHLEAA